MKIYVNYIGKSDYGYPTYKDQNGKLWFDVNLGCSNKPKLHKSSSNNMEGEPDHYIHDVYEDAEIVFESIYENKYEHDYRMLSRYLADCKYFLGAANKSENVLYYKDVTKHLEEMKKLYATFPEEQRPEWLTEKQLNTVIQRMTPFAKENRGKIYQIQFKKCETGEIHGGILLPNRDCISGCTGFLYEAALEGETWEIVETYDYWVDLDTEIIGQ